MMAGALRSGWVPTLLAICLVLIFLPGQAAAFGAGNIPSIAQVEGTNWRHGDIEDMLKTLAFLHGKKWTTMLVKRTYFGNWLRDYSQAVDVGSLKGVNGETIRVLVWILAFLAFGYATEEFEVTSERLGVYRPEEHIDNPLGYADGADARKFDARLRGPVDLREVETDHRTGMKNYIANEDGNWATSAGYLRYSFARCIHFGRVYTHGAQGTSGKETDLCEALRCLGQALHCMEDFSAHSNYCELALRELGYHEVFPHCGTASEINIHGKRIYPLTTGTFGGVDFLHSVVGEATDHFTQSEVDEVNIALKNAEQQQMSRGVGGGGGGDSEKGIFGFGSSSQSSSGADDFISLISSVPGLGGDFAAEARDLTARSAFQEQQNTRYRSGDLSRQSIGVPGTNMSFDPVQTAKQIYPILQFRDKIVRSINSVIVAIPGLETLMEKISETLTAFVLGLLAPFIRPILDHVTKTLKQGSSTVISASAKSQLEPWKDPHCTDPTHSMLSKDHFTNVLNSCAGRVASTVLQYVVPRVLYAWENPRVPIDEVANDVLRAFHHPALRREDIEIQRKMFETVRRWADENPRRNELNYLLGSDSVRNGKNHIAREDPSGQGFGAWTAALGNAGHGKVAGSLWSQIKTRDLDAMDGADGSARVDYLSSSPAPGSAAAAYRPPSASGPRFGYSESTPHPDSGYLQPTPNPAAYFGYQPPPPPQEEQQQQQPSYGQGYPSAQQQPPYGQAYPPPQPGYGEQPPPMQPYGGQPGYGQGPPYGQQQQQQPSPWGPPQQQPPYYGGQPQYGGQPPYGEQPPPQQQQQQQPFYQQPWGGYQQPPY